MKNITLSASEELIKKARGIAQQRDTSLNELFRNWLQDLTREAGTQRNYDRLMDRLQARRSGRTFTREELNER